MNHCKKSFFSKSMTSKWNMLLGYDFQVMKGKKKSSDLMDYQLPLVDNTPLMNRACELVYLLVILSDMKVKH